MFLSIHFIPHYYYPLFKIKKKEKEKKKNNVSTMKQFLERSFIFTFIVTLPFSRHNSIFSFADNRSNRNILRKTNFPTHHYDKKTTIKRRDEQATLVNRSFLSRCSSRIMAGWMKSTGKMMWLVESPRRSTLIDH